METSANYIRTTLAMASDTEFGLTAYFYSRYIGRV
jgi:hypothetical protein